MYIKESICLQMLSAILVTLCIIPTQALANTEDQNLSSEKAIFNEIAKAHATPDEQATLQNEESLQGQGQDNLQELTNVQESLQSQELDPTKPGDFFDQSLINSPIAIDTKDPSRLALTAIFINKNRKIAVINGVLLKEGEVIAGKKVQEITASKVKLIEKKEILELKLPNYSIKREAS